MNLQLVVLCAFLPVIALAGADEIPGDQSMDGVSYSLGYKFGKRFAEEITDLDTKDFASGFNDAYRGGKRASKMTEEDMEATIKAYQDKRVGEFRERMSVDADSNAKEAAAFLEKNGERAGVITTSSGLQYEVVSRGVGPSPQSTDIVIARYHGTLINGEVFDSTRERDDIPAEFPLNRVIPGWTEGVQLMSRGSKFKLYVPPELGFGHRGAGGKIGPNQVLVFDIELVDFRHP